MDTLILGDATAHERNGSYHISTIKGLYIGKFDELPVEIEYLGDMYLYCPVMGQYYIVAR